MFYNHAFNQLNEEGKKSAIRKKCGSCFWPNISDLNCPLCVWVFRKPTNFYDLITVLKNNSHYKLTVFIRRNNEHIHECTHAKLFVVIDNETLIIKNDEVSLGASSWYYKWKCRLKSGKITKPMKLFWSEDVFTETNEIPQIFCEISNTSAFNLSRWNRIKRMMLKV